MVTRSVLYYKLSYYGSKYIHWSGWLDSNQRNTLVPKTSEFIHLLKHPVIYHYILSQKNIKKMPRSFLVLWAFTLSLLYVSNLCSETTIQCAHYAWRCALRLWLSAICSKCFHFIINILKLFKCFNIFFRNIQVRFFLVSIV